jgi:hypothetical protein
MSQISLIWLRLKIIGSSRENLKQIAKVGN